MTKRSFAVIGGGALGGLYGGMLARAGFDVHFLLRSDAQHVRQHGLRVDSKLGDFHLHDVNVYDDADAMPACDVTILALKTTNNDLLPRLLPGPTGTGGTVLVLQNGLNVEADTAAVVGGGRVLGGCCFLCSNKVGPGHIRHLDYGRIVFGRYSPASEPPAGCDAEVESIATDLQSAGIDAHTTDDLWKARWRKLMWNIPFNGLSVALDASTNTLMDDPHATELITAVMQEVAAASAACGREQPADAINKTLDHTRQMVPYDSSMRLDYKAGRAMELEAILGNPIQAARQAGVPMPKVEMLYQQLWFLQAQTDRRLSAGC
ncbi:putative 2-dehydropantoate 2-reductase [Roseimaritima ulvae]|uniref:2-dehydropantoate 2-reductase n=1 Tax=Roseimaritima ulvae TaxID=980254 RepID=A0A5B9QUI6_9BACT|nr:putative 2-dehydropantoate 2-reductase [Roseimaritima ulvae]QEG41629.1 2-dehydropantoate 2-reductase [Roseimaritima ulvae]